MNAISVPTKRAHTYKKHKTLSAFTILIKPHIE